MSVIAEFQAPAESFVLGWTLEQLPDVRLEVERVVTSGREPVTPYFWVSDGDLIQFETLLEDDPTIEDVIMLEEQDGERFYRGTWRQNGNDFLFALSDVVATVLEAVGQESVWELTLLFNDHDALSAFHERCATYGVSLELTRLYQAENPQSFGKYEVTADQQEALVAAYEMGYFEVPRDASLADVADRLSVSSQSVSARLRRGCANLIGNTLVHDVDGT